MFNVKLYCQALSLIKNTRDSQHIFSFFTYFKQQFEIENCLALKFFLQNY